MNFNERKNLIAKVIADLELLSDEVRNYDFADAIRKTIVILKSDIDYDS